MHKFTETYAYVVTWMSRNEKLPKISINFWQKTLLHSLLCAQDITYWSATPLCLALMLKNPENIPILLHM